MTPKGQSQKDARMRREGYDDGYALLAPKRLDAEYQRAWRKGRETRRRFDAGNELVEWPRVGDGTYLQIPRRRQAT